MYAEKDGTSQSGKSRHSNAVTWPKTSTSELIGCGSKNPILCQNDPWCPGQQNAKKNWLSLHRKSINLKGQWFPKDRKVVLWVSGKIQGMSIVWLVLSERPTQLGKKTIERLEMSLSQGFHWLPCSSTSPYVRIQPPFQSLWSFGNLTPCWS